MRHISGIRLFLLVLIAFIVGMCNLTINRTAAKSDSPAQRYKAQSSQERRIGRAPEIAKLSSYLSPLPADERMKMVISFEPGDEAGLLQLINELYDPASPRYHQWLTPEEFGEKFGRPKAEFDSAIDWLKSNGFQIDQAWPNNLSISFSGTVDVVERAFNVDMGRFINQSDNRIFYSNRQSPSLPPELESIASSLIGLNDADEYKPALNARPSMADNHHGDGSSDKALISPQGKTTTGGNYLAPVDLAVAYNYKPLTDAGLRGQGQQVGIVIDSDMANSDIALYRSFYSLPPANVRRFVAPGYVSPGIKTDGFSALECALDVASISAVVPSAEIDIVLTPNLQFRSIMDAELFIVNTLRIPIVNESFGGCEENVFSVLGTSEQTLMRQAVTQGIAFFASSGDEGIECSPGQAGRAVTACPACYDAVTSVGGTQIDGNYNFAGDLTSIALESVWNDPPGVRFGCDDKPLQQGGGAGGGGFSQRVSRPDYQTSASGFGGVPASSGRVVPDISALAGRPRTAVATGGRLSVIGGGTSQASPLWAGMMALINQFKGSVQGSPNRELYRLGVNQYRSGGPAVFRDITVGNNSTGPRTPCAPFGVTGVSAAFGYDAVTGWGVPNLDLLARNFGTGTPPPGGDTVALTSGSPQIGSIPAPPPGQGVLGATQYTIQVPSGAAQLRIDLSGNQDVDLFVRFGQKIIIDGGGVVSDFKADSASSSESITITPASSPSLQAGTYFIAVGNIGPGAASFSVTATVTPGAPPGGDTVTLTSGVAINGTVQAPSPGFCLLASPQYTLNIPANTIQVSAEIRAPLGVTLFLRFGQRVTIESNAPVFDRSVESNGGVTLLQLSGSEVRSGPCFFALGNCATSSINFTLTVTAQAGSSGNNAPVIRSLVASLDGDVLKFTGTATDADGDIVQGQSRTFNISGGLVSQTSVFSAPFNSATSANFTIQVTNLNSFPTAMRGSLILIDSRGNRSLEVIADFSQPDPGGPTLSSISYDGARMKIKGKGLIGTLSLEVNGQLVATRSNDTNKKAKISGSPSALNLRFGPNRVRLRRGSLRSNLFLLDF